MPKSALNNRNPKGAGCAQQAARHSFLPHNEIPKLTFTEAEAVARDLERGWPGLTNADQVPSIEALTDIVQRVLRKAREVVLEREG